MAGRSVLVIGARENPFVHVNLIPMDRERVIPDQTVIVKDGLIMAIGPADATSLPRDTQVIEGEAGAIAHAKVVDDRAVAPANAKPCQGVGDISRPDLSGQVGFGKIEMIDEEPDQVVSPVPSPKIDFQRQQVDFLIKRDVGWKKSLIPETLTKVERTDDLERSLHSRR